MGYDVHITRAQHWLDANENPITLTQWLDYAKSDTEFRIDTEAVAYDRKKRPLLAYASEGLAVWTAYSKHQAGGDMAWFDWRAGRITVKNPDDEILAKMKRVAAGLGASVVGDDGEHY